MCGEGRAELLKLLSLFKTDTVESSKQNPQDCLPERGGRVPGLLYWYVAYIGLGCVYGAQVWGAGSTGEEEQAGGGSLHTAPAPLRCSTPARATHSAHAHTIVTFLICWCSFAQPEAAAAAPPAKVGNSVGLSLSRVTVERRPAAQTTNQLTFQLNWRQQ